jgi:hypothetical protein
VNFEVQQKKWRQGLDRRVVDGRTGFWLRGVNATKVNIRIIRRVG